MSFFLFSLIFIILGHDLFQDFYTLNKSFSSCLDFLNHLKIYLIIHYFIFFIYFLSVILITLIIIFFRYTSFDHKVFQGKIYLKNVEDAIY